MIKIKRMLLLAFCACLLSGCQKKVEDINDMVLPSGLTVRETKQKLQEEDTIRYENEFSNVLCEMLNADDLVVYTISKPSLFKNNDVELGHVLDFTFVDVRTNVPETIRVYVQSFKRLGDLEIGAGFEIHGLDEVVVILDKEKIANFDKMLDFDNYYISYRSANDLSIPPTFETVEDFEKVYKNTYNKSLYFNDFTKKEDIDVDFIQENGLLSVKTDSNVKLTFFLFDVINKNSINLLDSEDDAKNMCNLNNTPINQFKIDENNNFINETFNTTMDIVNVYSYEENIENDTQSFDIYNNELRLTDVIELYNGEDINKDIFANKFVRVFAYQDDELIKIWNDFKLETIE